MAQGVSDGTYRLGILICGTGIGMSIAANKVPGVRAAVCTETFSARMARAHNDANVLVHGRPGRRRGLGVRRGASRLSRGVRGRPSSAAGGQADGAWSAASRLTAARPLEARFTMSRRVPVVRQEARVHMIDHPLVQHKLTILRDERTGPKDFRELTEELSMLMAYEVTRDMPTETVEVKTPVARYERGRAISGKKGGHRRDFAGGARHGAGHIAAHSGGQSGHIGVYRDPDTLAPVEYYCKLPTDIGERDVIMVDPMLATGGSAVAAIDFIKQAGRCRDQVDGMVAAPKGIARVARSHPDVPIYVAAVDEAAQRTSVHRARLGRRR